MKWATRMVCGYCSLEQSVAGQCKGCGRKLATTAGGRLGLRWAGVGWVWRGPWDCGGREGYGGRGRRWGTSTEATVLGRQEELCIAARLLAWSLPETGILETGAGDPLNWSARPHVYQSPCSLARALRFEPSSCGKPALCPPIGLTACFTPCTSRHLQPHLRGARPASGRAAGASETPAGCTQTTLDGSGGPA